MKILIEYEYFHLDRYNSHLYRVNSCTRNKSCCLQQCIRNHALETLLKWTAFHGFSFSSLYALVSVLSFFVCPIYLLSAYFSSCEIKAQKLGKTTVHQEKKQKTLICKEGEGNTHFVCEGATYQFQVPRKPSVIKNHRSLTAPRSSSLGENVAKAHSFLLQERNVWVQKNEMSYFLYCFVNQR